MLTTGSGHRDRRDWWPPAGGNQLGLVGPVLAGAAGAAMTVLAVLLARHGIGPFPVWVNVLMQPVGVIFQAFGLYVWVRQPYVKRIGILLWTVGFCWYLGDLQLSSNAVLFAAGFWLFYLNAVVLAHLLLASPDGQLKSRAEQVTLLAGYGNVIITQGLRLVAESPLEPQGWGAPSAEISIWAPIGSVVSVAVIGTVVVLVARRWRTEPDALRHARGLFWLAVAMIGIDLIGLSLASLLRLSLDIIGIFLVGYALSLLFLAVATLVNSFRMRPGIREMSLLLEGLRTGLADNGVLRDRISEALGDPSLTLHYRRPDLGDWVDIHGAAAPLPLDDRRRAITYVGPAAEPVAAIVHDRYLPYHSAQRMNLRAIAEAVALTIDYAQLLRRVEDRAKAQGIHDDDMATRKRIGANLHDGPQHRLSALRLLLSQMQTSAPSADIELLVERMDEMLQAAARELREVAQDAYPATIRLHGLTEALDQIVANSPIPVIIDAGPLSIPDRVAEAAFFLISEAVGNAVRHANPTHVVVRLGMSAGGLVAEIDDDGIGGATPKPHGGGLRGMHDRSTAIGGSVTISSPAGRGTRVRVELLCE